MKIQIIDKYHIMLVASETETIEYSNHTRVLVNNKDSFVCNSEPSSTAYAIVRPEAGTLLNVPLDITYSPYTTDDFLIVYLEMDDGSYSCVLPCYNHEQLLHDVANKVGIIEGVCGCSKDINKVYPIVLYYGFKLALSILDIQTAIRYWNRLYDINTSTSNCNCNGH